MLNFLPELILVNFSAKIHDTRHHMQGRLENWGEVGHADVKTTQIYANLDVHDLSNVVSRLD
ncbi:MAG: hypothetical protein KJ799_09105 [Bacteroidetes bacterium]|nr:hypothetical protein [Bacteroidota bacterium]MBU1677241.1 hypothetical protein [Bacteroidota bacterium]MBU2506867.1 hypothetical protein [Bacteroidota bacterium]